MKLSSSVAALLFYYGTTTSTVNADHHLEDLPDGIVNNATFIVQAPSDMAGELLPQYSGLVGPFPLDVCSPLCKIDAHCNGTLACFQRDAYEFIPGCSDCANSTDQSVDCIGDYAVEYCWDIENEGGANWTVSTVKGKDGEPDNGPLSECEGYCRDDDDCGTGLVCDSFAAGEVPGCIGGYEGFNYCYKPANDSGRLVVITTDSNPTDGSLGQCQGDCDNDSACAPGLYCFERQYTAPVPGCPGDCNNAQSCSGKGFCTAVIETFAYDIEDPVIDVEFSDDRSSDEFIFNYKVSQRNFTVELRDYDNCNVTSSDGSLVLTTSEALDVGPYKQSIATIDVDQSVVAPSDFFRYGGTFNETGYYEFCIRIDLLSPDNSESVHFLETKTNITVDLTKGFDVISISTDRDNATETNETAELEYSVLAYQCTSSTSNEQTSTLTQGSIATICVETNSTSGVYVDTITELEFHQDDFTYVAITEGTTQGLTSLDCNNNEVCVTETQMISEFFTDLDPSDIIVNGTVVMKFGRGRRLSGLRQLQADDTTDKFDLQLHPQSMHTVDEESSTDESSTYSSAVTTTTTMAAGLIAGVIVMISSFVVLM